MTIIHNGKRCEVRRGATVAELRAHYPDIGDDDIYRLRGSNAEKMDPNEELSEGDELEGIPRIVKGQNTRIEEEVQLLRALVGTPSRVQTGRVTVGDTAYHGVIIKAVPVPSQKFGVTRTDMLFLLPPDYPRHCPLGAYLNYPWDTKDHHFTLAGHYGAPQLTDQGWYWYCVGLGGGFNEGAWGRRWKPGTEAGNGHNLRTLFIAAREGIRSGE